MKSILLCPLIVATSLFSAGAVRAAQKRPVSLDDIGLHSLSHPVNPVWSPNDNRFAYIEDGKLMVFDIASRAKRELLEMTRLKEAAAKIPDAEIADWINRRVSEDPVQWFAAGDRLLVSEAGDVFVVSLAAAESGKARFDQLTNTPVQEYDPKLSPDNRFVSFRRGHDLYTVEVASKKVIRLTFDGSDTLLNAQLDWVYPEELDLNTAHWWAPDSRHIAYLQLDTHAEPIFPQVSLSTPNAVLEPERFPKPGDPNADARVGVVSVDGGPTRWMNLGETQDHLIARVTWLPDSTAVAAMRLNRIQNNLDLLRADIATGRSEILIHEEDPYWINVKDEPHFFKDGKEFLWESERDGFRQLYLYGTDGKLKRQMTKGDWVMEKLMAVDEADKRIYYSSNEGSPVEYNLYVTDMNGKHRTRLTSGSGMHGISVSPHGQYFTDLFSNVSTPSSQTLRTGDGSQVLEWMPADRTIPDTVILSTPEIVQLPAANGDTLYARLVKPVPFDPGRKYPAIVAVYGGPGAQSVTNRWTGVNLEQLYAANGYVVWQLDNHGSYGRGHAFESTLFRSTGQHELEDQMTGIEYLKKLGYVDPARIGLIGWSYGGYMTLYSLVNAPDVFRAGIAGAPVTDWRNYDTIYTERYMGLPDENKDGYERSSPQTHAANLKAKLLIVHNIEDDNVHFANTLQMAAALERANRPFRMVIYPQKTHGVTGEYSKSLNSTILQFFEENLK